MRNPSGAGWVTSRSRSSSGPISNRRYREAEAIIAELKPEMEKAEKK